MKRLILPLIALTFLLGACSSPTKPTAQKPGGPPISTGKRATAWGELPTYDQAGHRFSFVRKPKYVGLDGAKPVTLDVVVNGDGSVKDATVTESSGNTLLDRTALECFVGAHYSLQLGARDAAPYVVRQQMKFTKEEVSHFSYLDNGQSFSAGKTGSVPESTAPMNQAWSGAGGGWSGGGYSNSSSSSGK